MGNGVAQLAVVCHVVRPYKFSLARMPTAALGCYGNTDAHMPNLDRMAAQGIRFNNSYCVNGICSPSRASLFTGLMPSQHGIHFALPDKWEWYPENFDAVAGLRTLPQTLKDNGYKTALIGKFHLGSPYTPQHGFDHWIPDEYGHTTDFWQAHFVEDGQTQHYDGHATDLWTEKAIDFLQNHSDDELYDLAYDPGEDNNVAGDPANAEVIAGLSGRIDAFFAENSSPKYDLWDGGMAMAYYYPPVQPAIWQDAFGEDWKPEFPK